MKILIARYHIHLRQVKPNIITIYATLQIINEIKSSNFSPNNQLERSSLLDNNRLGRQLNII